MELMNTNPIAAGIRHMIPNLQSKTAIKMISPIGVALETALSGRVCARYVSVAALESMTIFRILPVPSLSIYPNGNVMMWFIIAVLICACTWNAAI